MTTAIKLAKAHLKLNFPKPLAILFLMSLTMLAPHYPRIVSAMFFVMMISSALGITRETRSEELLLTLPAKRSDLVKGQALFVFILQLVYLLCCAAAALAAMFIPFYGKTVAVAQPGMVGNLAFFGVALAVYGAFNFAFMPLYYIKNGKVSPATLLIACIAALVAGFAVYGIFELLAQFVPSVGAVLRSFDFGTLGWQLLVLLGGAVFYVGASALSVMLAVKRYERG